MQRTENFVKLAVIFNWCFQIHHSSIRMKMTFYELKGLVGCEKPIFHRTTGGVQKAETLCPSWTHAQSSQPSVEVLPPTLLGGSGRKAKTERREARSRPQAGKKGVSFESKLTGETLG